MIRVLVADDSPTARALLVGIMTSDPEIEVVGEAENGLQAVEMTRKLRPDLVTMDLHMPKMDGFESTKEIMITVPTPIIIVSGSASIEDVQASLHTLRAGALAALAKPCGPGSLSFEAAAQRLISHVKTLWQVKVVRHWRSTGPAKTASAPPRSSGQARIVAIATSTGGPPALSRILNDVSAAFPAPILVVQHITQGFCVGLADWLNKAGPLHVRVAQEGEPLKPRTVFLAPDDHHLGVSSRNQISLDNSSPIGGFRPSGTFLFESVAKAYGSAALAVILTGMGEDGVEGLRAIRQAGGRTIAQDEDSSVVFGMPAAAIAAGLADQILPLDRIGARLAELVS